MIKNVKLRLLALHGKGTSSSIMRAQIKALVTALGQGVHIEYLQGSVPSAPYSGIESLFPGHEYLAWYDTPTAEARAVAHKRIQQRLVQPVPMADSAVLLAHQMTLLETPPDTPKSTEETRRGSGLVQTSYLGPETPILTPGDPVASLPFDGVICFSQGCAALTGLLLSMYGQEYPVRFVVLMCGGRPYDDRFQRIDASAAPRIRMPSIHVHGTQDPAQIESQRLYSLYSDEGKVLIELDIGHCPPRRSADVDELASAIWKMANAYC